MRVAFTEDQEALRDVVRDLLQQHGDPEVVRAAWDAPQGQLDRTLWDRLVELGLLQVLVPESDGGLGMDLVSLVGPLEVSGRVALPHPLVETAALGAPLLGARLAEGPMVAATWRGAVVPCGLDADLVLVVGERDIRLFEPGALELTPVQAVDGARRLARFGAPPSGGQVLTDDPAEVAAAFDRAALGTAAHLLGLCDAMLQLTVDHVTERTQFGVPIGSFQAVKHHLADGLMRLSFARPAVHRAAYALAHGWEAASTEVSTAKVLAGEAAEAVGRSALQCHGAIGYTVEHDLLLFLKRSWALTRSWGSPDWHTERVATALEI